MSDGKKKIVSLRLDPSLIKRYRAESEEKNVKPAALMRHILVKHSEESVKTEEILLAGLDRIENGSRKVSREIAVLYQMLRSMFFTYLVASFENSKFAFIDETTSKNKDLIREAVTKKDAAEQIMKKFDEKFLSERHVQGAFFDDLIEKINAPLSGGES